MRKSVRDGHLLTTHLSLTGENPAVTDCDDHIAQTVALDLESLDHVGDLIVIHWPHFSAREKDQELPHEVFSYEDYLIIHLLFESDDVTEGFPFRQAARR